MNSSSSAFVHLPLIITKANLTFRYQDLSNMILFPLICLFGMFTSLVTILILLYHKNTLKGKTYDYIVVNALIDFAFLFIEFWLIIIRCGILCPYGYSYWAKFYEIYVYQYVGYVLVTTQVMLSIVVSVERLKMFKCRVVKNVAVKKRFSIYAICGLLMLVSAVLNTPPYLIARCVVAFGVYVKDEYNNKSFEVLYKRITRDEFTHGPLLVFITIWYSAKDPLMFLIFVSVNALVIYRFRAFLNRRKILLKTPATQSKKKILTKIFLFKFVFFV